MLSFLRNISIKLRITLWYAVFILAVLAVGFLSLYYQISRYTSLSVSADVTTVLDEAVSDYLQDEKFVSSDEGVYLSIYNTEGRLILGRMIFVTDIAEFVDGEFKEIVIDGGHYIYKDAFIAEKSVWMRAAKSLTSNDLYMRNISNMLFIILPMFMLLIVLGGYLIVGNALSPVKEMSDAAFAISKSLDLKRRINLRKGKDELYALADTFNHMLDRVEASYEREKKFTSDVSHELRTPLSVMLAEMEYMSMYDLDAEETKQSMEVMQRQGQQMKKLLNSLLEISRLDYKEFPKEKISLSTIAKEMFTDYALWIADRDIVYHYDVEDGIYYTGNEELLKQVFGNLLSNALKFTKNRIYASLQKKEDGIHILVEDNGIGIPQKDLDKIWGRLYQVDEARTNTGEKGNGLGLSFVKKIADIHGGDVKVRSKEGVGSAFEVILFL